MRRRTGRRGISCGRGMERNRTVTDSSCSPETCHQDPGFTYGMGKRPLGRADKVKPSPQQTAPDAGPKLANMEEKWSFKSSILLPL